MKLIMPLYLELDTDTFETQITVGSETAREMLAENEHEVLSRAVRALMEQGQEGGR